MKWHQRIGFHYAEKTRTATVIRSVIDTMTGEEYPKGFVLKR